VAPRSLRSGGGAVAAGAVTPDVDELLPCSGTEIDPLMFPKSAA
jgi:hypothetical protein